jgi:hypothetical protein
VDDTFAKDVKVAGGESVVDIVSSSRDAREEGRELPRVGDKDKLGRRYISMIYFQG